MPVRVHVEPALLEWATERSGRSSDELSKRFPRLDLWASGDGQPTLKQLEGFARATNIAGRVSSVARAAGAAAPGARLPDPVGVGRGSG